jgi:ATP-dependent DNA helicase RecG
MSSGIKSLISFLSQPLESAVPLSKGQLKKIVKAIGPDIFNLIIENTPEKYEARVLAGNSRDLVPGEMSTVKGEVLSWTKGFGRAPAAMKLKMESGIVNVSFFGRVGDIYFSSFPVGSEVLVSGEVNPRSVIPGFVNPDIFKYDEDWKELLSGYVPVYRKIPGVSHLFILRTVSAVLRQLENYDGDWIDPVLTGDPDMPGLINSIVNIHFPAVDTPLDLLNDLGTGWHKRIAFDKLFFFQLGVKKARMEKSDNKNRKIKVPSELAEKILSEIPFPLTDAQTGVLKEIRRDLSLEEPMNRLLQGDVGSGKTVIMILAGLDVIASGYKTVIMAPTEILARQHLQTINSFAGENVTVELFTGGLTGKKKKKERSERAEKADFIVGTHALFENLEEMEKIGLVIIDEQHRFGVSQRMKLLEKAFKPDILIVSATPIPRSLALTIYGDTDISIIDEMPPGRLPITTKFVKNSDRHKVADHVTDIVMNGDKKGYWICPLVEESEKIDLQHVEGVYEEFRKRMGHKVLLLHGKMKGEEKDLIINSIKEGKANMLVSTVVVEVGVDITEASFIVIENAERFGLAQLHQLRGRVGRGSRKSFCALIPGEDISGKAQNRLKFISTTENGFKIAEFDLKMRGPGAFTGFDQSGFKNDPYFILAARYGNLVEKAGQFALKILMSPEYRETLEISEMVFERFYQNSYNRFKTS